MLIPTLRWSSARIMIASTRDAKCREATSIHILRQKKRGSLGPPHSIRPDEGGSRGLAGHDANRWRRFMEQGDRGWPRAYDAVVAILSALVVVGGIPGSVGQQTGNAAAVQT